MGKCCMKKEEKWKTSRPLTQPKKLLIFGQDFPKSKGIRRNYPKKFYYPKKFSEPLRKPEISKY